jgi:HEPN domain-containing protein
MERAKHIAYWLKSAEHDLESAETLFQHQRYDWCLFLGHLIIEKEMYRLVAAANVEAKIDHFIQYILKVDTAIEVHPFRSDEFSADIPFVQEILDTGGRVY